MTQVSFYYDVVCPYSYLETHAVEQAEDAGHIEVTWLPFELRPAPRPLQPRSTLPLAACIWATELGQLRAFKRGLYEAFFCEGEDVSSEVQIARAARGAGLDPDDAIAAAYSAERIARLAEIRAAAEQAGVAGVPSLVADGSHHWGMGGVERLLRGDALIPRPAR